MAARSDASRLGDTLTAAAIFALALALRLLYIRDIARAGLIDFLRLDPLYYHDWAVRIAGGDWLGRETFEMSPLYPYALAVVYKLFGVNLTAPRVIQALLGSAACVGAFLLGKRLFGRGAGALAGTMLALYGPAIYYDGQINKTTLAMTLSLAFAMALTVSGRQRLVWIAAGGLFLGLCALVHENVNVVAPIILIWLAWPGQEVTWRARAARAAVFVAGYGIAVLPVTARNAAVAGEWVLITSGGGENFYTGNNEFASGRYGPPPFVRPDPFFEHEDFRQEAARRAGHPVSRGEASRYWWREGMRFITGNPGRYLWLLWDKFAVFFNAFERPDNFSYYNFMLFSPTLSMPLLSFGIVMPLALLGIVFSAPRWRDLIPVYAGAGAFLASALIFFTQSRYRMPAVPFLVIFAAHGALSLAAIARQHRPYAAGAAVAALAATFLFVNGDPGNAPSFHAQNDAILGELYFNAGRLDEAAASFRRGIESLTPVAEAGNPIFARVAGAAQYGLGLTERRRGNVEAAEKALRIAARTPDPDVRLDALTELADIFDRRKDAAALASVLGEMAAARPSDFSIRLRYAEALFKIGRMRESLAEVRSVLALSPSPPPVALADAHYGEALIHIALGEQAAARESLERTLDLSPSHPNAAWIRQVLGLPQGAP